MTDIRVKPGENESTNLRRNIIQRIISKNIKKINQLNALLNTNKLNASTKNSIKRILESHATYNIAVEINKGNFNNTPINNFKKNVKEKIRDTHEIWRAVKKLELRRLKILAKKNMETILKKIKNGNINNELKNIKNKKNTASFLEYMHDHYPSFYEMYGMSHGGRVMNTAEYKQVYNLLPGRNAPSYERRARKKMNNQESPKNKVLNNQESPKNTLKPRGTFKPANLTNIKRLPLGPLRRKNNANERAFIQSLRPRQLPTLGPLKQRNNGRAFMPSLKPRQLPSLGPLRRKNNGTNERAFIQSLRPSTMRAPKSLAPLQIRDGNVNRSRFVPRR